MHLSELLHPTWEGLETFRYDGSTYYLGCEVYQMLGISSITVAMGRNSNPPKVSWRNWRLELIPSVNKQRRVFLINYAGVVEMIRNNNNETCKRLKLRLDD